MLSEQTYDKLVEMKMAGMATAFQEYRDEAKPDKLDFEERFGLFVDREWTYRHERRLKRRLSSARLREQACMEDIDYRHSRGLERSVMQRLATCKWIAEHENVIVTGATGLGKTWIACALANQACRNGYTATYTRTPRLLHDLAIARGDGSYAQLLKKLSKSHVLILDDWGLAPLGEHQRHDVLEVLEDRHGRRSTVVTSQLPVKQWHDHIGEATLADAILDRLVHNSHRIALKGASMRKARGKRGANQSS